LPRMGRKVYSSGGAAEEEKMRSIGLAVVFVAVVQALATPCFAGFVWAPTPGGVIGHTSPSPNVSQSQAGSDNLSVVTQGPGCSDGHVVTRQSGTGNVAVVRQCGDAGNSAVVVQGGEGNSSSIVMN